MIYLINSMTGFGRFEGEVNGRNITLEIKSVNHRYTEFNLRITRGYGFLEEKLKSYITSKIARGKIDMFVSLTEPEDTPTEDSVPMGEDAPAPSIDPERLEAAVSDEPAIPMPENRPEDFAVYFEWGVMEGNFLDSYNNKVGRDMVEDEDITADYTLSDTQLDEIYAALVQYKIAHIRTEMTYDNIAGQEGGMDVSPNTRYLVRFRADGREYTVKGDVTASFCDAGRDYEAFNTTLADMTVRIWRELKIPEPTSAYC